MRRFNGQLSVGHFQSEILPSQPFLERICNSQLIIVGLKILPGNFDHILA